MVEGETWWVFFYRRYLLDDFQRQTGDSTSELETVDLQKIRVTVE